MTVLEVRRITHIQAKCAKVGCTSGARFAVVDRVANSHKLYCPEHAEEGVRRWERPKVTT
jgi:hypothetical protein